VPSARRSMFEVPDRQLRDASLVAQRVRTTRWQQIWDVNVMAHIYSARAVLPGHAGARRRLLGAYSIGGGTADPGWGAPYSVTKHAAVAFAEWLSIAHGDAGIKVSCLCPQGVRTQMLLWC